MMLALAKTIKYAAIKLAESKRPSEGSIRLRGRTIQLVVAKTNPPSGLPELLVRETR
jgi:hypothetical protein